MTSSLSGFRITLALLIFASVLPASAAAQTPIYLTQWGSNGSSDGQFNYPTGIATDAGGNVYVTDTNNHRVQKFTSAGAYVSQWGSFGNGDGQFIGPSGIAIDAAGFVYVVDQNNMRVEKFTSTGAYVTQWGSPGSFGNGHFYYPQGIAIDAAGNVFVTDQACGKVQKFTNSGTFVTQWGSCGSGPGEFNGSAGVAADVAGNVYVADQYNHRIQKFSSTGTFVTQWGSFGAANGQFKAPYGVALDAAGNVYVSEWANHRIQKFNDTGAYVTQWGGLGTGEGQFDTPAGVAIDASGNIYVAEQGNHRVQKFGSVPTPIAIGFDFTPSTLNLASQSLWITGFLEPTSPLATSDIDIGSIRLNGTVPVDPAAPAVIGDHDGDGVADLMVKFNRAAVALTLPEGDHVPVDVTGTLGGQPFQGTDHIRVRRAVISAPLAGSHLSAGSMTQIRWQTPSDITIESVALLQSLDGGGGWSLIARGQPNTGSYDWAVPNVQAERAKIAVVLVESTDESGYSVDGVLGVSEEFTIDSPVGVGDGGPAQFALRGTLPNPAQHELRVSFSLVGSKPATLTLFDVSGRLVTARRVDGMGPGWHTVALGGRSNLSAGVYVIRLTQDGRSLVSRAAVVR